VNFNNFIFAEKILCNDMSSSNNKGILLGIAAVACVAGAALAYKLFYSTTPTTITPDDDDGKEKSSSNAAAQNTLQKPSHESAPARATKLEK